MTVIGLTQGDHNVVSNFLPPPPMCSQCEVPKIDCFSTKRNLQRKPKSNLT